MKYSHAELNITLKCNLNCTNCNRCPHIFAKENTDISMDRIIHFVNNNRNINKIKVLGGEPLLHPNFTTIYYYLIEALKDGKLKELKIDRNKTLPIPKEIEEYNNSLPIEIKRKIRWMGKRQVSKKHLPVLWSPLDLGYDVKPNRNCLALYRCGFSLDYKGYLPCSSAIALVKIFNLNHLYKQELPLEPWGLDELCKHCIFNTPNEFRARNSYPINHTPIEATMPTKSFSHYNYKA